MNVHMAKPALYANFLLWGHLGPRIWASPMPQADSCLQPLQNSPAHHSQVRQCKHHHQLAGVLCQTPVAHLAMAELALDDSKRVLDRGTDAGLEFLQLFSQRIDRAALVHGPALARHHGDVPVHIGVQGLDVFSFVSTPVARVGKDHFLFDMQQGMCLRDVVRVGGRGRDRVHQARVRIHANVRLHAKVPLVALLDLVHLGVTFTLVVLGRAGRCNQRGVHHGAGLEHQTALNEFSVHSGQDLLTQPMLFEQVTKAQDRALVGQSHGACIQVSKFLAQRNIVQGLFHGRIGVTKEMLQQMDVQHHLGGKRRAVCLALRSMRRNQGQQLRPRDHQVHLDQKLTLARALGDQLESVGGKAHLFHDSTVSDQAVSGLTSADLSFTIAFDKIYAIE